MSEYDKAPARALHRFTLGGAARKREGSSLESPSFGRNFKMPLIRRVENWGQMIFRGTGRVKNFRGVHYSSFAEV